MAKIAINHAEGRGKRYVALITGRDPKYKFARQFLPLVATGGKFNCYEDFVTIDDVADGAIVETMVANYKGKQTRKWLRVETTGTVEITEDQIASSI